MINEKYLRDLKKKSNIKKKYIYIYIIKKINETKESLKWK